MTKLGDTHEAMIVSQGKTLYEFGHVGCDWDKCPHGKNAVAVFQLSRWKDGSLHRVWSQTQCLDRNTLTTVAESTTVTV